MPFLVLPLLLHLFPFFMQPSVPARLAAPAPPAMSSPSIQPSPELLAKFCGESPTVLQALRTPDGRLGGYVSVPLDFEGPIAYFDAAGNVLTVFAIDDTDEEKSKTEDVINRLEEKYPVREQLSCPNPQ